MPEKDNHAIIDIVKEITVAKLSNSSIAIDAEGGKKVADFMQSIYDKLVELYQG